MAHRRVGTYWHVFPELKQGRTAMWNGVTKDGRKFMDHFPDELIESRNNTDLRIIFKNGSVYQIVGTDNINALVGTNPIGVVFSEYSLCDPAVWDYLRPILAENDGWALFVYTMRGRNHGYKLYQMAKNNPAWFAEKLVAGNNGTKRPDGTPVISDEVIDEERRAGMPEEMIQQEFYNSADAPLVGAYYSVAMEKARQEGRICEVPYEPKLPLDTFWDLGFNDSTTIWFGQEHGGEIRLVDFYTNSGQGLPHYAKLIKGQFEKHSYLGDAVYGTHYAPWDIVVHDISTGLTRLEAAKKLGIKFKIVPKHEVMDGIDMVRSILPRCYFDEERCANGLEALRSYKKEYDSKHRVFKENPCHDWSSHAADAFRYMAMTKRLGRIDAEKKRPRVALDNYDYFAGKAH
jgi:phage terminase large subunit